MLCRVVPVGTLGTNNEARGEACSVNRYKRLNGLSWLIRLEAA